MAADPNADIDLYAGVDELDPEIHQGESGGLDLYDDVLTTSTDLHEDSEALQYHQDDGAALAMESSGAVPTTGYEYKSYTTVHPKSAAAQAMQSTFERPRGKPLYVGNLTWWTNDQTLTEALQECGVTDLINIKFFENRTNGQSKGLGDYG